MVERVARAIYASHAFNDNHDSVDPGFDGLRDDWRAVMFANARAAIEALRTPTAEIVRALDNAAGYPSAEAWGDAIDAALTSHTDTPKET